MNMTERIQELERELESVKRYATNYLFQILDAYISVYSDTDVTVLTHKGWVKAGKPNGTITPATAPEQAARDRWNAEADEYNQWDSLSQDEKDELIQNATLHLLPRGEKGTES